MTLRQKLDRLIDAWQGSDALNRSAKREQLVSDLIAVFEQEQTQAQSHEESEPSEEQVQAA